MDQLLEWYQKLSFISIGKFTEVLILLFRHSVDGQKSSGYKVSYSFSSVLVDDNKSMSCMTLNQELNHPFNQCPDF